MEPFTRLTSVAVPLLRDNVDTDAIIPSREMTSVSKASLADGLFAGWRYTEVGGRQPDPAFVLNDPAFAGARILIGGSNFGCGSSREHAAWALAEYGFRAIVAPSFNPIFRGNCVRNGIVPAELDGAAVAAIADEAPSLVTVDLPEEVVTTSAGRRFAFSIDAESKEMLVAGLDAIELTLQRLPEIEALQAADRRDRPWAYL